MYKRILVPTDGSEITDKAVKSAIAMAKLTGAEVFALAVKEPFPYSAISEMQPVPPQEFLDAQERVAAARVKVVADAAAEAGVRCQDHRQHWPGGGVAIARSGRPAVQEGSRLHRPALAGHGRRSRLPQPRLLPVGRRRNSRPVRPLRS